MAGPREYQNLIIECRYTEGREERAPALVSERVSFKPDPIVANTSPNVHAAKQVTSTISIVMVGVATPVKQGLVDSIARPSCNVRGLVETVGVEIVGKRL